MAKHFGNLQYLKGVTYYVLSPTELKPLKGFFNPGFQNLVRKARNNLFPFGVPALCYYLIYDYVSTEYKKSQRKNPNDFINDE